jgi:hypothetical protein
VLNSLSTTPWRHMDVYSHIFLTSALVGGDWLTSRPGRFTPGERAPSTHWIGSWWAPELVWMTWRRENSWPYWYSNSHPSAILTLSQLLLHAYICINVFKAVFLHEKHSDNKTRVTSVNLVLLNGNHMRQKKGYFVWIGITVLCANAFSQSNHSNNDNVRDDSHFRPTPACFCVASLKVVVAMRNKKTITVMMWLELLSMEKGSHYL